MGRAAVFRGIPVEVIQARVRERDVSRYYYEIRAGDDGWASNATLEEKVAVNFWGTLISSQPIDFQGDDYVELTDGEMRTLLVEQEDRDNA